MIKINKQIDSKAEEILQQRRLEFAKMLQQIRLDIALNKQSSKKFTTKYTSENIKEYLENPQKYEKEMRAVTRSLCVLSPQFNRLVNYIPDMAVFNYVVIPSTDVDLKSEKGLKDYYKWCNYLENMNIQHEFIKIIKSNFKYDVYYGYELEEKDSYYIKTIDPDYCKIISVDDGCFNYAFDFTFFDKENNKDYLEFYPQEFQTKYKLYKSKGNEYRWQEMDSNYTICTKYFEDLIDITYPPYCNTFDDLYDISDYKQIDKQSAENENYQLIGFQLETKDGATDPNDFTVDPYTAMQYFNLIQNSLPAGVGAFLSPVKYGTVDFSNKNQTKIDRVSNSTRNFWDSAGVADVLFSSGATTAGTLKYSMMVDTNMLYGLYRQLERWVNRKLKRQFRGKVSIKLLDVNRFNQNDFIDQHLKLAQYGVPSKLLVASAIGLSPVEMLSLSSLENDILNLSENWIPLSSSHTATMEEGSDGRPESKEEDLTENGVSTRDNNTNDNRE